MELAEVAFFTDDVPALVEFYRRLLDSDPVDASDGTATFLAGGTRVFIHATYVPGEGELVPEDHIAFTVDDVDATCEALREQGVEVQVGPRDFYWGRSAYLRAPNGKLIELAQKREEGGA
ncbi:MAG TPA: VOC family protein [Anaerolineae bacterium]|nr:VOC family protein [Anaerolineae bacterium]